MAVIAKINNLAQITYRTDLFAQGQNSYHLRRNPVIEHVIKNKGTSSEYEQDYTVLISSYKKHKDIQAKLPDGTIHPFEIGYGVSGASIWSSYTDYCPIVVDKILFCGDFSFGDMNYTRLAFEKPAIGLTGLRTSERYQDFIIINEITQSQDGYMKATGIEYTPENGYTPVTNKSEAFLWCDTWEVPIGQTQPTMNRVQRGQSQINVCSIWESDAYDKNGDLTLDNGGYYMSYMGMDCYFDTTSLANSQFVQQHNSPELQSKIATMFEFGGARFGASYINFNSDERSNINHSSCFWQRVNGTTGRWVQYTGIMTNIIVPFTDANERDAAKAAIKYWTRDERTAFDEIYGE